MSIDVALVVALALLSLLVAALLRAHADLTRRVAALERMQARNARSRSATVEDLVTTERAESSREAVHLGDGVDVVGVLPDGRATTVQLQDLAQPTLLAFLSTSCGICTSIWQRLRDGALAVEAPDMACVVVAKDAAREDLHRVRELSPAGAAVQVVLAADAWDDYEIPGSPYLLVLTGRPATITAEGAVTGWDDVVAMVRRASR